MPYAIFNFKPYILWLTPVESKDTICSISLLTAACYLRLKIPEESAQY